MGGLLAGWLIRGYTCIMVAKSAILEHVIEPDRGGLRPELAQYLLTLDFPPADHARYAELTEKAQGGLLTDEEKQLLEEFLRVNEFLTIVQTKARLSLGEALPSTRSE